MNPPERVFSAVRDLRVAILIPCHNEAQTIGTVVRRFREEAPEAAIYVFDNSSTDGTAAVAREAGATVILEPRRGKGHVVRSMFRIVDADVYVMVDGDNTYPADVVGSLVDPIGDGDADMVIGSRLHPAARSEFRPLNRFGNQLFRSLLGSFFGVRITDLLSGYRSFSRRLVRALPLFGGGFETETEMTIKALHRGFRIVEVPVNLVPRPVGSDSKVRIFRDGVLILSTIVALFRDYKPLTFFGLLGIFTIVVGLVPTVWGAAHLARTGSLNVLGWIVIGALLVVAGALAIAVGLVLHTIVRHFQEMEVRVEMLEERIQDLSI